MRENTGDILSLPTFSLWDLIVHGNVEITTQTLILSHMIGVFFR